MEFILQPLTLLTFFPLVGVLVLLFLKPEAKAAVRWTALVTSSITFVLSIWVLTHVQGVQPRPANGRPISLDHRRRLEY